MARRPDCRWRRRAALAALLPLLVGAAGCGDHVSVLATDGTSTIPTTTHGAVTTPTSAGTTIAPTSTTSTTVATPPTVAPSPAPPASTPRTIPQEAVQVFDEALVSSDPSSACQFLLPNQQAGCKSDLADETWRGTLSVGPTLVEGNEALVALTGQLCGALTQQSTSVTSCEGNSDPETNMPSAALTFAAAYAAANSDDSSFSPVPCIKSGGEWWPEVSLQ